MKNRPVHTRNIHYLLFIVFMLIAIRSYAQQSIKEQEMDLRCLKSDEEWGHKMNKAWDLLKKDSCNEVAIEYIVQWYYDNNQKQKIDPFFNDLSAHNPKSTLPYLIRIDLSDRYEKWNEIRKINYLKKAISVNPNDINVNYAIGKLCYSLFNKGYKTHLKQEYLNYYARNAIYYFNAICKIDPPQTESLKYPLIQLYNYIGEKASVALFERYNKQESYAPLSAYLNLPATWRSEYKINVIEYFDNFKMGGIEYAIGCVNTCAVFLKAMGESALTDNKNTISFRVLILPSFHRPVMVRIENSNNKITLYWKACDGKGGYEPGKLAVNKKKTLTFNEWNNFLKEIGEIRFWQVPTVNNRMFGCDGTEWILEGNSAGLYHIAQRWEGGIIAKACMVLLKMTDLKIGKEEID